MLKETKTEVKIQNGNRATLAYALPGMWPKQLMNLRLT